MTATSKYLLSALIAVVLVTVSVGMFAQQKHAVIGGKGSHLLRSSLSFRSQPIRPAERPVFGPARGHRAKGDSRTFGRIWMSDQDYASLLIFAPTRIVTSLVLDQDSAPRNPNLSFSLSFRGPPTA